MDKKKTKICKKDHAADTEGERITIGKVLDTKEKRSPQEDTTKVKRNIRKRGSIRRRNITKSHKENRNSLRTKQVKTKSRSLIN